MTAIERIYLDNAATSWPKPPAVYAAVDGYLRHLGAPAGRSTYRVAGEVDSLVQKARRKVAQLIGVEDPRQIVFTFNGTDALNLAIHGILREGDHVVTTVVEHNSVLRPLRNLEDAGVISVSRVPCDGEGIVDPDQVRAAITPATRLVAMIHASNVTGAIQPAAEVAQIAHGQGALFLLDAAQSLGHLPLSVLDLEVDLLAAPGHKGLLGPLGTGILCIRPGAQQQLNSVRQGGTGTHSELDRQPDSLPDKYESGNLNVPGIAGLAAGVDFLRKKGMDEIRRHDLEMTQRLLAGLAAIAAVRVYGPADPSRRVGVVSVTLDGYDPHEVGTMLDAAYGIQTRPGLHCAPLVHQALGTVRHGGTVRFSVGPFTTAAQIDATIAAVAEITSTSVIGDFRF